MGIYEVIKSKNELGGKEAGKQNDLRMKILLVDDRSENLLALESVLESLGQIIVKATSGRDALKHVLDDEFAVILLDVQMPEMNGFETASLIRAREKSQHTPIVFLTAINKSDSHVTQGYSVGAVDYVFKPFDAEVLRAKVGAFVELSKKTKELQTEIERRRQAETALNTLNAELERRVADRTSALQAANKELKSEVAERRRAEKILAEKQAHIEALNAHLQRAMTETHHRVKNNLQLIAAMLDMRLMERKPSISAAEIKQLGSYVRTLATVHDLLTQQAKEDGQAHFVSAREVLETLLPMIQEGAPTRHIKFHIDDTPLSARQSTSLALVANELVSNALKHGQGEVGVQFLVEGDCARLSVSDDGPGFPSGFDAVAASHMGLELIDNLSRWDLGGTVSYLNRSEGGAKVVIEIPLVVAESTGIGNK